MNGSVDDERVSCASWGDGQEVQHASGRRQADEAVLEGMRFGVR